MLYLGKSWEISMRVATGYVGQLAYDQSRQIRSLLRSIIRNSHETAQNGINSGPLNRYDPFYGS